MNANTPPCPLHGPQTETHSCSCQADANRATDLIATAELAIRKTLVDGATGRNHYPPGNWLTHEPAYHAAHTAVHVGEAQAGTEFSATPERLQHIRHAITRLTMALALLTKEADHAEK